MLTRLKHSHSHLSDALNGDQLIIGDQQYHVERVTRGGMGFVLFLKKDQRSPMSGSFGVYMTYMVLKCALPGLDDEFVKLFNRELTVWAGLVHPNIVRLVEILDCPGSGWVAMMHREGGTVRDILKMRQKIKVAEAKIIILQILDGLEFAFQKDGVLHLDIKPENVLFGFHDQHEIESGCPLTETHRFRVSDWGISSLKNTIVATNLSNPTSPSSFQTMNNMGTTRYMAPERFSQGHSSSIASDAFSLGMMYLELVTGRTPFDDGGSDVESLLSGKYLKIANDLLSKADVAPKIQSTILKLIDFEPSNRPSSHISIRALISQRVKWHPFNLLK